MRHFAAGFTLQLKRLLRKKSTLACLLLLPLLLGLLRLFMPTGQQQVQVGVYLPSQSRYAGQVFANLQNPPPGLVFVRAQTPAQLENMVAANRWECGFVLAANFDEQVEKGRYVKLITCVRSPATSMDGVIREAVSAAVLQAVAPGIAQNYLEQNGLAASATAPQELPNIYNMDIVLEIIQNGEVMPARQQAFFTQHALSRGLVALCLFLFMLLCSAAFLADTQTLFYQCLRPYTGAPALLLPVLAAAGVVCMGAGGAGLILGGVLFPGLLGPALQEAGLLAAYVLYLCAVAFLLCTLLQNGQVIVAVAPFLMVACLVLCPILWDVGLLLPALGRWAAVLPPTLYLQAAAGKLAGLWGMLGGSLLCFAASGIAGALRQKRGFKA